MSFKSLVTNEHMKMYFNDEYEKESWIFDILILSFIFLSCLIFVFENSISHMRYAEYFFAADLFLNIFFSIEFFLRIFYSSNFKKHFGAVYTWIDFLAILPFWFGWNTMFFRVFRFFRIFRIFRFLNYSSRHLASKEGEFKNQGIEKIFVAKILFSIFLFWYVSSALIFELESGINPKLVNFADALYLVLISVSTVGYGDIVPVTELGRIVIMGTVLVGLIIVPWHMGSLFKYLSVANLKKQMKHEENLNEELEEKILDEINFCPHCGKKVRH